MSTRKLNITALLAVPLMLLMIQQVFDSDLNRIASAQSVGQSRTNTKDDKIEPKTDRPWDAPLLGPRNIDLSVHGITTTDVAHLWIVGREGDEKNMPHPFVLRSTDSGNTWQKRRLDDGLFPFDIYFIDDQVGWIAGARGLILQSTDGGRSWNKQSSRTDSDLMLLQFIDRRVGWIAGDDGELLRTTDGGKTWQSCKLIGHGWGDRDFRGWLNALSFSDRFHGWFVGDQSKVFETTDGGKSWRSRVAAVEHAVQKRGAQVLNLTDVHFFSSRDGILLADVTENKENFESHQAHFMRTEDGGRSWRKTLALDTGPFRCLNFASESEGWMTTGFGHYLVHTTDGGRSWLDQDVPGVDPDNFMAGRLFQLKMADSKRGWGSVSVYDYPVLDKVVCTTDGGQTWRDVKLEHD